MIFLSGKDKLAQVSAWLRIHLCSRSQNQSRHVWFDWTTKGLCDGWKMRRALTCHFNPLSAPSHLTRACAVCSPWAPSDIHGPVFRLSPPVPRPHVQPVTSLPSWLSCTSILQQHSNSRALLYPTCMHKDGNGSRSSSSTIFNEPLRLRTGISVFFRVPFDSEWRYYLKPAWDNILNKRDGALEPSNPSWYILTDSFQTSIYRDERGIIFCLTSPVFLSISTKLQFL